MFRENTGALFFKVNTGLFELLNISSHATYNQTAASSFSIKNQCAALPAIVRRFFRNINIMRMALSHAGIGYFYKHSAL